MIFGFKTLSRVDVQLTLAVLGLTSLGLLQLYALSSVREDGAVLFWRQLIFAAAGVIIMMLLAGFNWRLLRDSTALLMTLYLIGIGLLAAVYLYAPELRGVKRWLLVGGLTISPGEIIKFILVVVLAKFFSFRHVELYRFGHIALSFAYVAVPAFLVLLQPDFSGSMLLVAVWMGMLLFSGIKIRHLLIILLAGVIGLVSIWFSGVLEPYQKERALSFIRPQEDPLGASYNIRQALIAVSLGGWSGSGLGLGTQAQLRFLPEAHSDFIFAALVEEQGFLGALVVLSLFGVLFWRLFKISIRAPDNFSRLVVLGFSLILGLQVAVHVGINLGLAPVTGLNLPFISAGGMNLLLAMASIGLAQSIAKS